MQEIKGQYANAKIYADVVEQTALDQIQTLCNQPFAEGSHIAVMPDVHAGVGCTIGTTMTIDPMNGKVCPNLVGVDIGCGMSVTELGNIDIDFSELDRVVHKMIPSGRNAHSDNVLVPYPVWENTLLEDTRQTVMRYLTGLNTPININYELDRLGTLGSGNHYIEIDKDEEGNKYLVIHSGSRHLGVSVCSYFMDVANAERIGSKERHDKEKKELITRLKAEGRSQDIASALIAFDQGFVPSESSALAYVEKDNLLRYLNDMKIAQWFAQDNRDLMTNIICAAMNWTPVNHWETVHNYIDIDHGVLRKGSISLRQGERALIPVSMKDGALIVTGKGNPDYNYSGPHGAGRLLSRTEARRSISLKDFEESMKGIYTTSVSEDTLDESAFAYKRLEDILPSLEPTAEIEKGWCLSITLKPENEGRNYMVKNKKQLRESMGLMVFSYLKRLDDVVNIVHLPDVSVYMIACGNAEISVQLVLGKKEFTAYVDYYISGMQYPSGDKFCIFLDGEFQKDEYMKFFDVFDYAYRKVWDAWDED